MNQILLGGSVNCPQSPPLTAAMGCVTLGELMAPTSPCPRLPGPLPAHAVTTLSLSDIVLSSPGRAGIPSELSHTTAQCQQPLLPTLGDCPGQHRFSSFPG